jgi:hypothetical protein
MLAKPIPMWWDRGYVCELHRGGSPLPFYQDMSGVAKGKWCALDRCLTLTSYSSEGRI